MIKEQLEGGEEDRTQCTLHYHEYSELWCLSRLLSTEPPEGGGCVNQLTSSQENSPTDTLPAQSELPVLHVLQPLLTAQIPAPLPCSPSSLLLIHSSHMGLLLSPQNPKLISTSGLLHCSSGPSARTGPPWFAPHSTRRFARRLPTVVSPSHSHEPLFPDCSRPSLASLLPTTLTFA